MKKTTLLSNDTVLIIQPQLIAHFGKSAAMFLSQLNYWLQNSNCGVEYEGQRWVYNTAEEWAKQLHLSVRHVRRLIAKLTKLGILRIKKLSMVRSNRTNYYSIDHDRLSAIIKDDKPKNSNENNGCEDEMSTNQMSLPSCQNGTFSIHRLLSNKSNKSRDCSKISKAKVGKIEQSKEILEPVAPNPCPPPVTPRKKVTIANAALPSTLQPPSESVIGPRIPTNTTTQDMLKRYNDTFPEQPETKMTRAVARWLVAAFKAKFGSCMIKWQQFLDRIRSSKWMMSSKFKLCLDWVLKFTTIDKILAGFWGVVDIPEQPPEDQQIVDKIEALPESPVQKATRHAIARVIGYAAYLSWFHAAAFAEIDEVTRLVAPNDFVKRYWEDHFDKIGKFFNGNGQIGIYS